MPLFTTFTEPVRVKYISTILSKATIFNVLIAILTLVIPYLICYRMQGFWLILETFREQPQVLFKHQALAILEVKNADGTQSNLIWTTFPGHRSMVDSKVFPFIRSREPDVNYDAVKDYLDIDITFPLQKDESVFAAHIVLLFEYKLKTFTNLEMESMVYAGYVAGSNGSSYEFTGDLSLVQKQPLWSRHYDNRFNNDVVPRHSLNSKDYSLGKIIKEYAARNVSTTLKNKYELWTTSGSSYTKEFSIIGKIMYTEDSYQCWAGIWQMLKWAWIQYFCVFIVVYSILRAFQRTVYKARLFETVLVVPWEKRHVQMNF
ncbi:Transmembrane protein [Orchesella cincta]|uniref:Transmembrane protein 231 n=1 Tax=Orchesella cincta TaxID=48709 RepID=A0A1D2N996_ORCCI|nr:Transmembrane protein [Orchesella cincta]